MNPVNSGTTPTPVAEPPPQSDEWSEDDAMLLEFIRQRDAPCPLCGYNLRSLTRPYCPECRQHLRLTVGVSNLRLAPMLVAAAPGIFSGIAAGVLLVVGMVVLILAPGQFNAPWQPIALFSFGATSGAVAVALLRYRSRFLRLSPWLQWLIAAATWAAHITAFGLFVLLNA